MVFYSACYVSKKYGISPVDYRVFTTREGALLNAEEDKAWGEKQFGVNSPYADYKIRIVEINTEKYLWGIAKDIYEHAHLIK